ncbi:hypothetical protein KEH51_00165 [[Brevibacterium] frigoritolerans]|uniref:Uncharacterized protein n=1 Tax=Peribacillus frigoritolerans TaxID=450367 RepID=A0A941FGB1_9BACI|nr:hypothetical protein [Peribacillus frigoritolerans]
MERKVRDSCGKSESRGDPAGARAPRRLPDRPRKASAWSGNQRQNIYSLRAALLLLFLYDRIVCFIRSRRINDWVRE